MKVFAFADKPEGYDKLLGKVGMRPGSAAYRLLSGMVFPKASTRADTAREMLRLTSYRSEEFENGSDGSYSNSSR